MRRLGIPSLVAGLVTLALSGLACKQGLGDRCEQNSDCGSGLVCNYNGLTTADMGRCINPNAPVPDAGAEDTAVSIDADLSDSGPDQDQGNDGASGDAPASDAAPGQDATDDGASADAVTSDAAVD